MSKLVLAIVVAAIVVALGFALWPLISYRLIVGGPPTLLFSYNVQTVISLEVDGRRFEQTLVTKCEVRKGGGGLSDVGAGTSGVGAGRSAGANHHIALPDGSALVIYNARFCIWKKAAPRDGQVYEVLPRPRGRSPRAKDYGPDQVPVFGRVAWLADGAAAEQVRIFDLADVAADRVPGLRRLRITAQSTTEPPSEARTPDIPILPAVRSPRVPGKYKPVSPEEKAYNDTNVMLRSFSAHVSLVAEDLRQACVVAVDSGSPGSDWFPVDQCAGRGSRNVGLSLSGDLKRFDVNLSDAPANEVAYSQAAMVKADVVPEDQQVCLENQCYHFKQREGVNAVSELQFYHPSTDRLVTVSAWPASMEDFVR